MKRKKQTVPGVRIEKDPETGLETVYPAKPNRPPAGTGEDPQPHEQIQHLIEFIDDFRNETDFEHIRDFVLFITLPLIEKNPEALEALRAALEAGRAQDTREIIEEYPEDPEPGFDEIPQEGYETLRDALIDIQGMTAAERKERFETIYKKPQYLELMNTKVAHAYYTGRSGKAYVDFFDNTGVTVGKIGKKVIEVNFQAYSFIDGIKKPHGVTPHDWQVFTAVTTLIGNGQLIASPAMVYEVFAGKATNSKQALHKVTRSLQKLGYITNELDWTEHAKMKGLLLSNDDSLHVKEPMLITREITATINGNTTKAFQFLKEPILYTYAKAVGQIITVDKSLLVMDNVQNTENNIILKNEIISRIALMKNQKNRMNSNSIKFSTLFSDCGISGTKTQMNRYRKTVFSILDNLKDKGYITGYVVNKKGLQYLGVTIEYIADPPQIPAKKNHGKEITG